MAKAEKIMIEFSETCIARLKEIEERVQRMEDKFLLYMLEGRTGIDLDGLTEILTERIEKGLVKKLSDYGETEEGK